MKPIISFLLIALLFIGCSQKEDSFPTIRDYIMDLSQQEYKTTLELSIETNSLGSLSKYLDIDLELDEGLNIRDISLIEFGIYKVVGSTVRDVSIHGNEHNARKIIKRLKRAGYTVKAESKDDGSTNVLVYRVGKADNRGALYFVNLSEEQFILVRVSCTVEKT